MRKGFTLIELLVVIVIIGILVAIALPNFIRIKDKAKEAEVKQNLHAIQLSLERYGVDSLGNEYPFIVMGGDWTDSYVVWQSWVDGQNLDISEHTGNQDRIAQWEPAAQDVGDTMVMEAYMPSYPGNPFVKKKTDSLLPTIPHMTMPGYPGNAPFTRIVGGRQSNKMWECFGPCFNGNNQSIVGDWNVHHIYFNPEYETLTDVNKTPPGGWDEPSGNRYLTGNFSYWPRGSNPTVGWSITGINSIAGYTLAGYGSTRTAGQDAYNRNGNYSGRFRTEPCAIDCPPGPNLFPDIPCLCDSGGAPTRERNDGGSDTVQDGVVITLDSGLDKKSGAASENTESGA